MQIFINNELITQPIIEREHETVGAALAAIDGLLEKSGAIITALALDGEAITDVNFEAMSALPIERVQKLELTAQSLSGYKQKAINNFLEILHLSNELTKGTHVATWRELTTTTHSLAASLSGLFSGHEISLVNFFLGLLDEIVAQLPESDAHDYKLSEASCTKFLHETGGLLAIFQEYADELADPASEFTRSKELFNANYQDFCQIALYLQTNQEEKASQSLLLFSEIFNKVLRLLPILARDGVQFERVGTIELHDFYAMLNKNLQALTTAFVAKDTVLIGDLAEYEIAPSLKELFATIEEALHNVSTARPN